MSCQYFVPIYNKRDISIYQSIEILLLEANVFWTRTEPNLIIKSISDWLYLCRTAPPVFLVNSLSNKNLKKKWMMASYFFYYIVWSYKVDRVLAIVISSLFVGGGGCKNISSMSLRAYYLFLVNVTNNLKRILYLLPTFDQSIAIIR